ncbi:MAG: glycosyltransferase family 2 protein [Clostridia bacterium]|nr:glycosyltransferase family 2 protein [Clostridia bacterium]
MKYLSVVVPCYNSQDYMEKCIDSVLHGGDDVEIIIVDDESKDNTGKIADEYAAKYPDIIRVIHQNNGGHGEGVNQGVLNSTGLYFKVVDSDDWLNTEALDNLLSAIKKNHAEGTDPDLYICNYVYEHTADNTTYVMSYKDKFPDKKIFTWNEMKGFGVSQCLMMHSVVFRTKFLQKDYIPLPKHTFYVDNIYMYRPLPYVKSISYLNLDLYRYFIGRDDQSITEANVIKRLDMQMKVTELMFAAHDLKKIKAENKKLYQYMLHNLAIMMHINASFSFLSKDKEKIRKFRKLWKDLKANDRFLYYKLRYGTTAILTNMYGAIGRAIYIFGYRIAKKIVKFQ